MPEEFSRTTARKRITLPNGGQVDVPVITKISFIDPVQRHQEYQYTIENSAQADRRVHVDQVASSADPGGEKLPIERIDKWITIDPVARAQESQFEMDNVTGGDSTPPRFTTHLRTHIKRYVSQANPTIWIESELIDAFTVVDPVDRAQESIYTLNNTDADASSEDAEISDSGNGIDPPWRTDPFQNIVDWNDQTTTGDFWYGLLITPGRAGATVSTYWKWGFDGPFYGALGEWPIPPPPTGVGSQFYWSAGTVYIKHSELVASALAAQAVAAAGVWPGGQPIPGGPQIIPPFERILWRVFPSPGVTDSAPLNAFPILDSFAHTYTTNYVDFVTPHPVFQVIDIPDDEWSDTAHSGIHDYQPEPPTGF
jgi:hypothetical protein